jgi:hypothetical protein
MLDLSEVGLEAEVPHPARMCPPAPGTRHLKLSPCSSPPTTYHLPVTYHCGRQSAVRRRQSAVARSRKATHNPFTIQDWPLSPSSETCPSSFPTYHLRHTTYLLCFQQHSRFQGVTTFVLYNIPASSGAVEDLPFVFIYIPASLLHFQKIILLFLFRERTCCPPEKREVSGLLAPLGTL